MTQMPYSYPPQQQYPPQYPAPQQFPQAPPQAYYPPPQQPPAAPPPAPVVSGTIDQFYNQPSAAGGPGISWKDKQIGTTYAGVISGECRVQQDTDFDTGRPLFQRDQVTPKWVMMIPLAQIQSNVPTPEFPDGEAVFYVRGQARDELVRAMSEAGCSGSPKAGSVFQVTLTHRKPNRKGNPSNIVQIHYTPSGGVPHQDQAPQQTAEVQSQGQTATAPSPVAAVPAQAPQQWAQQPAQPPVQPQAPVQQYAQPPVQQQIPQQPQAPQGQPMGQQVVQPAATPPADFSPEQVALLQRIAGQQG